jgi:hypothetical protein
MQDEQSNGLQPDIIIKTLWSDYAEGKDRQLEWIINDINSRKEHNTLIQPTAKAVAD